jgi:S-DNA-T family DNA segregation ATPase FtsK/SpoIIIE
VALGLIALALVFAIGSWFGAAGPVGALADDVARVWVGAVSLVVPVLLVIPAVVLMRSRDDRPRRTGPRLVGTTAIALGVTGILQVGHEAELAGAADSVHARKSAGGTVGWLLGHPLTAGVTTVPAILVLVLITLYGLLLLTGIPLVQLPGQIRAWLGAPGARRAEHDAAAEVDETAGHEAYLSGATLDLDAALERPAPKLRRSAKRRVAADTDASVIHELEAESAEAKFPIVARFDELSRVRTGDDIEVVVDTRRIHFFDLQTGNAVGGYPLAAVA